MTVDLVDFRVDEDGNLLEFSTESKHGYVPFADHEMELASLKAELEALRLDRERLDWLERFNGRVIEVSERERARGFIYQCVWDADDECEWDENASAFFTTHRGSIDAAMEAAMEATDE